MGGFEGGNVHIGRIMLSIQRAVLVHLPRHFVRCTTLFWYNVPMAIKYGVAVCECDQCGHRWLPESASKPSVRCPSRKCRSARWNEKGIAVSSSGAVRTIRQADPVPEHLPPLLTPAILPQRPSMAPRCPMHRLPLVRNDETGVWACRVTKCRQRADDESVKLAFDTADFASM